MEQLTKKLLKYSLDEIEKTTEREAKENAILTITDVKKGFNFYVVDFGGYFGISSLIFKNKRNLKHAADYQLHHNTKSEPDLIDYYITKAKNKVFTDDELNEPLTSYNDFRAKINYILNYAPSAFSTISVWGCPASEAQKTHPFKSKKTYNYCKDKTTADYLDFAVLNLYTKHLAMINGDDLGYFKNAISYELANHEAGYTGDYEEGLNSLGLIYDRLPQEKQEIVRQELRRQIMESY